MTRSFLLLTALAAALAAPGRAHAQAAGPLDERACLREYVLARSDAARARSLLESCTRAHPDSFALQRTLGRLLAKSPTQPGDMEAAREHLAAAAALDPAQFADDWVMLAELAEKAGDLRAAGEAWQSSLPFVTVPQRLETLDHLWDLWRKAGDADKALAAWAEVWHRHGDDFDSQVAAGRLLRAAGRTAEAKDRFQRAVELRPDDAEAQAALQELLRETAGSGGAGDKRALLESWLPRLGEADVDLLATLLEAGRDLYWPEATRQVATELARRQPGNGLAQLELAEQALADGRADTAARHAEQALSAGNLPGATEGRAHELLARALLDAAHARYVAAGSSASADLIASTTAAYRRALSQLDAAQAAGRDVADAKRLAREALAKLGGLQEEIADVRLSAQQDACAALAREAQYRYDKDAPLTRSARRAVRLARSPGAASDVATLAAGTTVRLSDARWSDGDCWLEVRTPEGVRGWAPANAFEE